MSGHCKHCGYDGCVCDERAANRKAVMSLTKRERFETLLGHPKTIMNETPTHPELCQNCKPLLESSQLEWVKVGGMSVGLHRQSLQWVLRDKYSSDTIKKNAQYSQQLAAKSRELNSAQQEIAKYKSIAETAISDHEASEIRNHLLTEQRDRLAELVNAVESETYGGIYTKDVNGKNWFDARTEALQSLNQNARDQAPPP